MSEGYEIYGYPLSDSGVFAYNEDVCKCRCEASVACVAYEMLPGCICNLYSEIYWKERLLGATSYFCKEEMPDKGITYVLYYFYIYFPLNCLPDGKTRCPQCIQSDQKFLTIYGHGASYLM